MKYQAYIYPGTQHGFHNDTTPRYDEAAAKLSWSRTLAFFNENLRGEEPSMKEPGTVKILPCELSTSDSHGNTSGARTCISSLRSTRPALRS